MYIVSSSSHQDEVPQPPDETVDAKRLERQVDGTEWTYTVDPSLEQEFNIRVATPPDSGSGELIISGRGCNLASARVFKGSAGFNVSEARIIAGNKYSLSHIASTLMACPDNLENKDAAVSKEISRVFQSLSRQ